MDVRSPDTRRVRKNNLFDFHTSVPSSAHHRCITMYLSPSTLFRNCHHNQKIRSVFLKRTKTKKQTDKNEGHGSVVLPNYRNKRHPRNQRIPQHILQVVVGAKFAFTARAIQFFNLCPKPTSYVGRPGSHGLPQERKTHAQKHEPPFGTPKLMSPAPARSSTSS